jgi:hypothetical protein
MRLAQCSASVGRLVDKILYLISSSSILASVAVNMDSVVYSLYVDKCQSV